MINNRLLEALQRHAKQTMDVCNGATWITKSFGDIAADVTLARQVLETEGVQTGSRVGLLSNNCYEWLLYDLACQSLGAISVAIPEDEFAGHSLAEIAAKLELEVSLLSESQCRSRAASATERRLGKQQMSLSLCRHERPRAAVTLEEEVFTLVFSSGTTGQTKCLKMTWPGSAFLLDRFSDYMTYKPDDCIIIPFPLSIYQQRLMFYLGLWTGIRVVIADPGHFLEALDRFQPSIIIAPPQLFHGIERRFQSLSRPHRNWSLIAARMAKTLPNSNARARVLSRIFPDTYRLLGHKARRVMTGAAPTRATTIQLLRNMGIPLYEAYGTTETGPLSWNLPKADRIGSVGKPITNGTLEIRDGIVFARPGVQFCTGYLPGLGEDTGVFEDDGFIQTGDRGHFSSDGFLYIEGRKDDVIVTEGGIKLDPTRIELEIDRVLAGVTPVVFPYRLGGTQVLLCTNSPPSPDLTAAANALVSQLNTRLPPGAGVRRISWALEPPSRENGLLTRNQKINRSAVWKKYLNLLSN